MDIQKRIEDLCETQGWSPYELSKKTGLSANTVYSWRNKKTIPTIPMIERICETFEITLGQFFFGSLTELTEEENQLLEDWRCMSCLERDAINGLIHTYKLLKKEKLNE